MFTKLTYSMTILLRATGVPVQSLFRTGGLKTACEISPNNTVIITSEVKIENGLRWPAVEQVTTGCTLTFSENAGIEFKQVAMRFAGPLNLQSSRKASLQMIESYVAASAIKLPLLGRASKILIGQSRMVAANGNFTIDIFDRFAPQATQPVIQAAGLFSIWTDASTIQFKNAAVRAGSGIDLNLADERPTFSSEETDFITTNGTTAIHGNNRDIKIGINKGTLSGSSGVRVYLGGRNGGLGMKDVTVNGGNGPIRIGAGSYSASAEVSHNIQASSTVEIRGGSFGSW